MKLKMAPNSLFAILLRSPWWISVAIAVAMGLVGAALLPEGFRLIGVLSGLPFGVIGAVGAHLARANSSNGSKVTGGECPPPRWPEERTSTNPCY